MNKTERLIITFLTTVIVCNCTPKTPDSTIEKQVHTTINLWHKAAANADFNRYFNYMSNDAIFIGTDAKENWNLEAFKEFSKPYFDKGKAWNFIPIERNIYISNSKNIVWFDELLDTQMELCRGSGILKKEDNTWKIAHYVLSITIPNELVNTITPLKKEKDSLLLQTIKKH